MSKPTIPEVLPFAKAVYERNGVGCCAHIVLDDDNVSNSDVQFCLEQAKEVNHLDCIQLCELLMQMSRTQRLKLGGLI